ncbi:hypothetical protein ABPG77_008547 [Micractinium sp. CCAP 211/92]
MGSLDDLRARLAGLSEMLGQRDTVAVSITLPPGPEAASPSCSVPAAAPRRRRQFQPTVHPTSSVLRSANSHARDAPLGGLLAKYRDAEAQWLKEKGKLQLELKAEAARRQKGEAELRRVQEQLAFRLGEVKHLKAALKGRDGTLQDLQDRLREYEQAEGAERTAAETVRQAQGERDELRSAMAELLQRLNAANDVIGQADASMAALEAQAATAAQQGQRAEEEAAAARAETEALREEAADLRWKCGLLQQLADLTLKQNDDKTATLRQLLESESILDAGDTAGAAEGTAMQFEAVHVSS